MFNFKSSGRKFSNPVFKKDNLERQIIPVGIKTPLEIGNENSELFKLHVDPLEQLADNLRNLVQTNHGERLGRFNYGCNLKAILFDRNGSLANDYEKIVIENVTTQITKYLPVLIVNSIDITPTKKSSETDSSSLAKVIIKIKFGVPALRRMENSIEVVLYNAG